MFSSQIHIENQQVQHFWNGGTRVTDVNCTDQENILHHINQVLQGGGEKIPVGYHPTYGGRFCIG